METASSIPGPGPSETSWLDRRVALRLALHRDTACHLVAAVGETFWPARVLDLSTAGVRLLLRREFNPGAHVLVELANGSRAFCRALVMRVVHLQQRSDGFYVLGGEFARRLSHDEIMALIA